MRKKTFFKQKYLSKSPSQTRAIGLILAKRILRSKKKKERAFILGLKGDLGGGKTTFLQGFAKGLGVEEKILSPTFIILKKFEIRLIAEQSPTVRTQQGAKRLVRNQPFRESQATAKFEVFYHIDCYRIKDAKEILDLGFREIVSNSSNIVAIEWVDRVSKIIPPNSLALDFRLVDDKTREIRIYD